MKNSNQLAPEHFGNAPVKPSKHWQNVNADDIGEGFQGVADFGGGSVNAEFIAEFSNKFVSGSSEFIFFTVTPRVKVTRTKKKVPINIKNKITPKEQAAFIRRVDQSINSTADFFMTELLPISMSLNSAIDRVNEKTQQITKEKAELPAEYIRSRATAAISLRILRFLNEQFGLTKEEARYLREGSK